MTRTRIWQCLALAFSLLAIGSATRADDYSGYRIPEFQRQTWTISGSGTRSSDGEASFDFQQRSSTWNLITFTSYRWESQSDHLSQRFGVSLRAQSDDRRDTSDRGPSDSHTETDLHAPGHGYDGFLSAERAWYSREHPWGLVATSSLALRYGRSREDQFRRYMTPVSRFEDEVQAVNRIRSVRFDASLAPGVGRVRDVSSVVAARSIEDRLRRMGRLQRALTPEEIQHLAQVLNLGLSAFSVHDRPDRYLWREVSKALEATGALAGQGLDAEAVERAQESFALGRVTRFLRARQGTRCAVSATMRRIDTGLREEVFQATRLFEGDTLVMASATRSDRDLDAELRDVLWGFSIDHARPSGLLAQWDFSSTLTRGDGRERLLQLSQQISYQRLWLDRMTLFVFASHRVASMVRDGQRSTPSWQLSLSSSLDYQVEDSWVLSLAWSNQLSLSRPLSTLPLEPTPRSSRSNNLSLSLSWSPATWFHSDALDIHERRGRL